MHIVRRLAEAALRQGADVAPAMKKLGLDGPEFQDADAVVPAPILDALWHELIARSGDPLFGLHMAEHVPPGAFGALEFAALSCPRVLEGLQCFIRYYEMLSDVTRFHLETRDRKHASLRVRVEALSPEAKRQQVPALIGFVVVRIRMATWDQVRPTAVKLTSPAPDPDACAEYERVLGVAPTFGASTDSVVFRREDLERPLATANPRLTPWLEQQAGTPHRPRSSGSLAERVREILPSALTGGETPLGAVSRLLGASPRTLQRRLAAEGIAFATLVDEARRDMTMANIRDRTRSLRDIAFIAGFSKPAAFHRAFKRWTGITPHEFRQRLDPPALASP